MDKALKTEWLANAFTMELIQSLQLTIDSIKSQWTDGAFTGAEGTETLQLNARAIGQVTALEDVLEAIKEVDTHDTH